MIHFAAVWRKGFSAENIAACNRDTIQSVTSTLSTPQSSCRAQFVNRGYKAEANIPESSLVESMDYFIKATQDTGRFPDGGKITVRTEILATAC